MDHTLEILQLSYNKIGDDGISMIAEGLQGNNAITSLMIGGCGITMKGIAHYIWAYSVTSSNSKGISREHNF